MNTKRKLLVLSLAMLILAAIIPTAAFAQGGNPPKGAPAGPLANLTRTLTKAAADVLGMEPTALVQSLRAGQTPAELATAAGIPVDEVTAALQDAWNEAGASLIDRFVNEGLPPRFRPHKQPNCARQGRIGAAWVGVAAETTGLKPADFLRALKDGATPAEVATNQGSSGQAIIDAIIAAEQEHLAKAVADGKMTQEQADQILNRHSEAVSQWVETGENPASPRCRSQFRVARQWTRIAADTVGIDGKDFAAALRDCQTPAEIAAANGSSGQAIIDAIVTDAQARLDQAVAAGKLTQDQADQRAAKVEAKVTKWVNSTLPTKSCAANPS